MREATRTGREVEMHYLYCNQVGTFYTTFEYKKYAIPFEIKTTCNSFTEIGPRNTYIIYVCEKCLFFFIFFLLQNCPEITNTADIAWGTYGRTQHACCL